MKILLLGEYSRLHNSLKEGLIALGHQVLLVGTGDDFKSFPVDRNVFPQSRQHFLKNKWWLFVYKLTGYNYFRKETYKNLRRLLPELKGFDIVQLINEDAFLIDPEDEIKFFRSVFHQNNKIFLAACGEDHHVINYYNSGKMRYSILDPFIDNPHLVNEAAFSYKYLQPAYRKLHSFVLKHIDGLIPTDLDYAIPYRNHPKALPMIPNPINTDRIKYTPMEINGPINIFFGINRLSYYKKGSHLILKALEQVKKKYKNKISIIIAENLPYNTYIKKYRQAHIFIDQVYSYDQGYNALEAMAQGKCVLTGAEKEFVDYYQLKEDVAVNILPEVNDIVEKIAELVENPNRIVRLSQNARQFVEKYHNYKQIAQKYVDVWTGK